MSQHDPQPYQASAVAIGGRAVLIEGKPGVGKSTLALALIDRGATLIGDDGVMLSASENGVLVEPHSNIAGRLEIRGVGLVILPTTSAYAALRVDLDHEGERLPDTPQSHAIFGHDVPNLSLGTSDPASLPLRVEWALRIHSADKEPQ